MIFLITSVLVADSLISYLSEFLFFFAQYMAHPPWPLVIISTWTLQISELYQFSQHNVYFCNYGW